MKQCKVTMKKSWVCRFLNKQNDRCLGHASNFLFLIRIAQRTIPSILCVARIAVAKGATSERNQCFLERGLALVSLLSLNF